MYCNRRSGIVFGGLLLLILSALSSVSFAATHYVRAGADGDGTGQDWDNAYPSIPSSLVRGDTYYIAAGSYGSGTFKDNVSGSSVITLLHPTAASHGTDTGWNASYAGQAIWTSLTVSKGFYTFDGAVGGGPGSWGTGFGFAVQMPASGGQASAVSFGSGVSNVTFRHMDFKGRGRLYTGGDTDLFYVVNPYTNITISYSYLHDTDRTMILTWPAGGSGFTLEYSYLARNGVAEHREAWSAGTDSNVTVRYNLMEDIMGTGYIAIVNGNGSATNWNIYGNVFYWTGKYTDGIINTGVLVNRYDGGGCAPPAICVAAVNWHVYNNVIANIGGGSFTSGFDIEGNPTNYVVENNIWYNNHTSGSSGAGDASTADYNWFFGNTTNDLSGAHDVVGSGNPFVNWQGSDWRLNAHIPGLALAAPYNVDALGAVRGVDGIWDRGAYEYDAAGTTSPKPLPPSNLTGIVQ